MFSSTSQYHISMLCYITYYIIEYIIHALCVYALGNKNIVIVCFVNNGYVSIHLCTDAYIHDVKG